MKRYWLWVIAAVIVLVVIGLVWWIVASSPHDHNVSQTGSKSSPSPTVSISAPQSARPSSTPPAVAVVGCTASQLSLAVGSPSGTAGTAYTPLVFTNISPKPCSLEGFPGVSLVNASGAQIGQPATRDLNKTIEPVILTPNSKAHTTISVPDAGNYPQGACSPKSASVRVYPPNQTAPLTAKFTAAYCGSWIVEPIAPGITD
jgi:Domain of unknown function (DUF4232)